MDRFAYTDLFRGDQLRILTLNPGMAKNSQIVCETYVHGGGIMSGKFWQDLENAGEERAEFAII